MLEALALLPFSLDPEERAAFPQTDLEPA